MVSGYHHDYADFGAKVLQRDAGLRAHLEDIVTRAGAEAVATAPVASGEFKSSFVVGTAVEDHAGLRLVGFLSSTDPDAVVKEFNNPDPGQNRTMNKAMRKAIG